MIRSNARRRRGLAVALASLATAGLLGLTAAPVQADPVDSDTLVFVPYNGQTFTLWRNGNVSQQARFTTQRTFPGNFDGQAGTDLFLYNPGSAPDGLLHVSPSGSGFTTGFTPDLVSGTFTPIVGDFNGNALDDIFWYAPGSGADHLWLYQSGGGHTSVPVAVNGSYRPAAINVDGDGDTDIIWYAPGTGADSIWRFGPGGSHTTKSVTINGDYQLIPGYFGVRPEGSPQRRLLFFAKSGADSIWTFDTSANHTSAPIDNIDGPYKPVVGRFMSTTTEAVLFYRPGTGSERFIGFTNAGALEQFEPPTVNGVYDPAVGDFDGNGYEDIAWVTDGKATFWKFNGGGFTQATYNSGTPNTLPAVIEEYLFPN
jgi:hypothetical protein